MSTKIIASTKAQNNFGQVLDDVSLHHTRYIIKRRNISQAIILSLSDFENLLESQAEREKMSNIVREISPVYSLGEPVNSDDNMQ
jgi:PHD/YefM family antitoxin component YafN of YafNO toxin-antitoxin module